MDKKSLDYKRIVTYILIVLIPIVVIISIIISYNYYSSEMSDKKKVVTKTKKPKKKEQVIVEPYNNELPSVRSTYNNQNIMARIEIPNMNVNAYVTRASDNSYYLNYNIYNVYDQIGVPFFDYRNTNLNTDRQINIYGHNTQNEKIVSKLPFTNLESYTDENVFNTNKDIYLYIDERKVHYRVVAIKIITNDTEHMQVNFNSDSDFISHEERLFSNSLYRDSNDKNSKNDRLLVLQICHYNPYGSYLLVIAKEKV